LGGLSKEEAREIAMENGFTNAHKKDSQDICFVANGKYAEFIEDYLGKTYEQGDFCDFDGNILGTHKGLIRYTIGQRKGLGLALPKPMYVCRLDKEHNSVILGDNADIGCGCVLNPGTIIGKNTSVYPLTMLRGVYESDSIVKSVSLTVKRKT
jgi:tRNA-specific 2-thiouridylase